MAGAELAATKTKGAPQGAAFATLGDDIGRESHARSQRIIHVEFDRAGGIDALDLGHLQQGATRLSHSVPICYLAQMANQTKTMGRRTTLVPVTTMEEIPVLSERERAELAAALGAAETRVKAGKAIDYEPKSFKDRLIGIYRRGKR
jgi:hypothetical protein